MLEQMNSLQGVMLSQYVRARVINNNIGEIKVLSSPLGSICVVDIYSKTHFFHHKIGMVEIILDSEDKPLPCECLELFV